MPAASRLAWMLGVACALAGCNPQKTLWQLGLPTFRTPFTVGSLVERGGYLDATLAGSGFELRTFAPADDLCRVVLEPETQVEYVAVGPVGAFRRGDEQCHAVGIGSLREWRNRRPATQSLRDTPVPRVQASYRVVHRDDEVIFLRGRFPLASNLGFAGGGDTIAVVPNVPLCQRPIESGVSSMQFYPSGRRVLVLVSDRGLCDIVGLIQPLP